MIRLQTFVLLCVVATLGLAAAIAFQPGLGGARASTSTCSRRHARPAPRDRADARDPAAASAPTRLDAAPRRPGRQTRPRELVKLEREVALVDRDRLRRLLPAAPRGAPHRRLAARPPRHRSRLALGARRRSCSAPSAWDLVRADRPRPRDHDAPGVPLDRIAAVVASVEQL